MKVHLYYFSGTGNTRVLSEELCKELESSGGIESSLSLVTKESTKGVIERFEDFLIGIGFPVYDYLPPQIIVDFVNELPKVERNVPVFLYSTYSTSPLDAHAHLVETLVSKGYKVVCQSSFKSPAAAVYLFGSPQNPLMKSSSVFEKNIKRKVAGYAEDVLKGVGGFRESGFSISPEFHPLNRILQGFSKLTYGNVFYRNLKIREECTACGLCAEKCPDNNLEVQSGKLIIKSANDCSRCLGCHVVCPRQAISFTSSKRRGQFTNKKSRELYDVALE